MVFPSKDDLVFQITQAVAATDFFVFSHEKYIVFLECIIWDTDSRIVNLAKLFEIYSRFCNLDWVLSISVDVPDQARTLVNYHDFEKERTHATEESRVGVAAVEAHLEGEAE
jgi:hypothetical protein